MKTVEQVIGTVAYLGGVYALPEQFCWSWSQMILYNSDYVCGPGERIHYDRSTISFHAAARNGIVNSMMGDWLFMTDTDHQFDPDILARLLRLMNLHNLDIVTGLYVYKTNPHQPTLYQWIEERKNFNAIVKWDGEPTLLKVDSAGGGCLLVRRRVFRRIKDELKEGPFDIEPGYGEDHSFFNRVRKLGIQAYCAVKVESDHLLPVPLNYTHHFKYDPAIVERKYEAEVYQ